MLTFIITSLFLTPELNHPTGIEYNNPPQNETIQTIAQSSSPNPTDLNPLDYENKIENTIYQSGDRLIIIQSIPIKYINQATSPNTQPTNSTTPSL